MKLFGLIVVALVLSPFHMCAIGGTNIPSTTTNNAEVEILRRDLDYRLNTFETNYVAKLSSLEV